MNTTNESIITVNSQQLSEAEATTLRVALNSFLIDMQSIGDSENGKRMASLYQKHAKTILEKMQ